MLIQDTLFDKGFLTGRPGLPELLRGHEEDILKKIRRISSLGEMTDAFLGRIIKDSLVEPFVLHLDRMTRQQRTEDIDGAYYPFNFNVYRGKKYPTQVVRISIPFSGDPYLLKHTPSSGTCNFPRGQVSGKTIQFDIILYGSDGDGKRAKEELDSNLGLLKMYAENSAKDINAFNQALPAKVKAAFEAKLEQLTKQHSIFDDLGIEEEKPAPAPPQPQHQAPVAQPKKGDRRAVHIIQYIEKMYVQQLNQTNNNAGDVSNAIQSD